MARIIRSLLILGLVLVATIAHAGEPLSLLPKSPPVTGNQLPANSIENRPVIVTFFASWCPPCTVEFLELNEIRKDYSDNKLTIVAVNLFEKWGGKANPPRMGRFLKRTMPAFYLIKGNAAIAKAFGNIERIPSLIIYDRNGREVWRFVHKTGATKQSATAAEIRAVLGALN